MRIPQLKDCKHHFDKKKEKGKGTMVFICEGQSAAGSITSCRDVNNQAVFVLKGKLLNGWNLVSRALSGAKPLALLPGPWLMRITGRGPFVVGVEGMSVMTGPPSPGW